MVIVSKEGSILYEGERGLVYSRGISSNRREEEGESKPGRMFLGVVLSGEFGRKLFLCLGGRGGEDGGSSRLRKRKFCLVRPEWEDGSSNYRSAKNGAKRGVVE
jgi:hypothetical protein